MRAHQQRGVKCWGHNNNGQLGDNSTADSGTPVDVIEKSPQTISFTSSAPSAAVVGGPTYTVAASGGASGNPVTFSIGASASAVCTVSGSVVSFTGAGTCVIQVNQVGNADYNPAPQMQQSFSVFGVISSAPKPIVGKPVTFSVGGVVSGSVSFKDNNVSIAACVAVLPVSGIASCTTHFLAVGTHTISTVYSNGNNNPASVFVTVIKSPVAAPQMLLLLN